MRYQCQIYWADRKPVDEYLEKKVEVAYSEHLDKASKLQKDYGVAMNAREMSLFSWNLANLEYENASLLSYIS
ncbi:hypothetical protein EJD97_021071 [Solanum chilense]|uniref:Uncharacterized protein n=1 Tax=Solanum chilense TaxID=4083 RepID=A0A6N2C5V5_SOLCI|nr:hypothetical protein EJD97_021071 [Solanum chilense]